MNWQCQENKKLSKLLKSVARKRKMAIKDGRTTYMITLKEAEALYPNPQRRETE